MNLPRRKADPSDGAVRIETATFDHDFFYFFSFPSRDEPFVSGSNRGHIMVINVSRISPLYLTAK